jgi:signal recognition particle receptor subunit beta
MSSINRLKRELLFKVVFYGPGLGGKTTTLRHVHSATKAEHRGNMVSLATDTDRTLYFDFLPIKLMKLGDMVVKLQLYTVPGQVYYAATRKLVLSGADGVVFVADTQNVRLDANLESLEDLNSNLAEQGRKLSGMPHVFQWNKRDLPDVTPLDESSTDASTCSAHRRSRRSQRAATGCSTCSNARRASSWMRTARICLRRPEKGTVVRSSSTRRRSG